MVDAEGHPNTEDSFDDCVVIHNVNAVDADAIISKLKMQVAYQEGITSASSNMNFLPEAKRNTDVISFLSMRMHSALKIMDTHLEERDWLATDEATIADLACCGYLYYPEQFTFDRAQYPHIDRWLDRIAALPGWKHPYDLMPGSPADRA